MKLVVVAVVVVGSSLAIAQPKKDPWAPDPVKVVSPPLKGPAPEVGTEIVVPAIPTFEIVAPSNGRHTVQELRVNSKPVLGSLIEVEGTITWIYNCLDALQKKGESRAKVQKRIDADPTLCERAKFYVGDSKTTAPERSLWVVDVPRPPNKLEKERLPKEDIARWPAVPKLAVGDRVVVTGTFTLQSPHSERNSDGLLVFSAIAPAQARTSAPTTTAPPNPPKVSAFTRKKIERHPKDLASSRDSIKLSNECVRAYGSKQYDDAIAKCKEAITRWGGNAIAYYALGGAHIGKGDWTSARDAMDNAVSLAPDDPMYTMMYGRTMYEAMLATERAAEAKRQNTDPSLVIVDPSKLDLSTTLAVLQRAAQLEPKLWRAHYYIGRIYRDGSFPVAAATELREAIALGATESAPFIALGELYRKWDFPKEAREIALLGTARITGVDASDLWYVAGMAYDDERDDKLAVQAFTQALSARPDNAKAFFQRGQAYFRMKDKKRAKADLEAYVKSPAVPQFGVQQANKMLLDLAATR